MHRQLFHVQIAQSSDRLIWIEINAPRVVLCTNCSKFRSNLSQTQRPKMPICTNCSNVRSTSLSQTQCPLQSHLPWEKSIKLDTAQFQSTSEPFASRKLDQTRHSSIPVHFRAICLKKTLSNHTQLNSSPLQGHLPRKLDQTRHISIPAYFRAICLEKTQSN
jgi:hypothetical protein